MYFFVRYTDIQRQVETTKKAALKSVRSKAENTKAPARPARKPAMWQAKLGVPLQSGYESSSRPGRASVKVSHVAKSHLLSAFLECRACKVKIKLQTHPKSTVSNRTRHAKTCANQLSGSRSQSPPSSSSGPPSRANVHASDLAPRTLTDHHNIDLAGPDSHNNETVTAAVEPDSIKAQAVNMTESESQLLSQCQ